MLPTPERLLNTSEDVIHSNYIVPSSSTACKQTTRKIRIVRWLLFLYPFFDIGNIPQRKDDTMAKAKHPKLPNGFGSIKKLSGNRTNKFGVYPPVTEFRENGSPITPKALCYVSDWYIGFYALMEYKNGTFNSENFLSAEIKPTDRQNDVITKIIASYNNNTRIASESKTFAEVYEEYFTYKYEKDNARQYSRSSLDATRAAYKHTAALHDKPFKSLKTEDLQAVIDSCTKKHATKEHIKNLFKQLYDYAYAHDLCDRKYADHVRINTPDDDEKGEPFTDTELSTIWQHSGNNEILQAILIMIYSGYRISAYSKIEINMNEQYFRGGVKTRSGKDRIVPFHTAIIPFIKPDNPLFHFSAPKFRALFFNELKKIGIENHTPHDCRHTFSWLCDKYKVDSLCKKMLMGHALGNDVTDLKYGHRTTEELRAEINKICR